MVSNTLPLGSDKYNTAQILVMAYLKGSDGSKKPETPPVSNDTPILSSRFNPTKKYPLDLNFYWASQKPT